MVKSAWRRWRGAGGAGILALALCLALPLGARGDLGSALKKAGEGLQKGSEDLKEGIENARDRHITKPTTADEMAKAADQQLRAAQDLMNKGEREKAMEQLIEAASVILDLKEKEPGHTKIAGLENRANKLAGDLKRRTGKDVDIWTEARKPVGEAPADEANPGDSAQPAAAPSAGAATSAEKLPYHADQAMKEFDKQIRSIDGSYKFIEGYKKDGEPAEKWLTKLDEVEAKISEAEKQLAEARTKAAEKDVAAHPAFDVADEQIAAEKKRVAAAREEAKAAQSGAAASRAGVEGDVDAFVAEYERLAEKYFNKMPGTAIYANDMEPVEELLALIEDFEANAKAGAEKTLQGFMAKYGATKDEVREKVEAAGYEGQKQPEYKVPLFQEGLANAAKQRGAEYDEIMKRINLIVDNMNSGSDLVRLEKYEQARQWMKLAERADAVRAKTDMAALEERLAGDKKAFLESIEAKTWPGNSTGKDAEAALKYFRESEDWAMRPKDPRRVLGVAVRGEWSVQMRNLIGNPTMHGLPVWIAVQVDSDKDLGVARVYNVTMRTAESADSKAEPPFTSITVGDSWYVKADKVK